MVVTRMAAIACVVLAIGMMALGFLRVAAQERITLTVAESVPEYRLGNLSLIYDDPATAAMDEGVIAIDLKGAGEATVSCRYSRGSTPTATFLINALNKADLSSAYAGNAATGSLKQRIYHRLVVMGESTAACGKTLTGTLAGAVP